MIKLKKWVVNKIDNQIVAARLCCVCCPLLSWDVMAVEFWFRVWFKKHDVISSLVISEYIITMLLIFLWDTWKKITVSIANLCGFLHLRRGQRLCLHSVAVSLSPSVSCLCHYSWYCCALIYIFPWWFWINICGFCTKKQGANKKLSFIFWVKWERPEISDYICLQERLTLVGWPHFSLWCSVITFFTWSCCTPFSELFLQW